MRNLVDNTVETYGRIYILINHAGMIPFLLMERLKVNEWGRTIDVKPSLDW